MSSVNISIKKEAYDFLKELKSEDQSFSDVILRFKRQRSPMDFFGKLKSVDWDAREAEMRSFRSEFDARP